VTIANGLYHSLAAQENGHAVGWGNNVYGESTVPASLTNIFDIAGGNYFSVAVESPLSINLNITPITGGSPETNTVAANGVVYYSVSVPTNAIAASNLLIFATAPLNVWFDQTNLPQPANPPDFLLLGGAFGGTSNILTGSSTPPLVPGQTYYVAVQNTNNLAVNYVFGVNFDLAAVVGPTNPIFTVNIVHTNIGGTNGFLLSWFAPTNDAFEVQETPSLQPVTWNTFTNVVTYNGPPTTTNGLFTFFDDGTQYPFGPMRFYQVVLLSQSNTIPTGGIKWLAINVPTNAIWATNILSSATAPLNVWFTTNFPPTTNSGNIIITYAANGVSILGTTTAPTNIVPGGTYYIGLDNGPSSVPATYNFQVDFALVQPPPAGLVFNSIVHTNISGTNGFLLSWLAPTNDTFQVQETPSLQPVNWHTFTNIITYSGPLTMTNGLFKFFDDGKQVAFGPMRFYRILLLGGSGSSGTLVLPAQSNYIAAVSQPMVITNAGTDSNPAATITYHLANFPTPATNALISTNGLITWTPGTNDAGGAFKFTTVAQDNSLPVLSATNAFTVFVMPAPPIGRAAVTSTNTTLTWRASTNDLFQVEWTTNLTPVVVWSTFLPTIGSTSGFFSFTDTNKPVAMKFYRLIWLPLP